MAKAVAGKDDTLWSFPPEIYYDLGPALRRPTLGHLFLHSYIVMTIILRRSQTGHCETRYFSSTLYFCVASHQLEIPFTRYRCILCSLFPVLNCLYMIPSRFCDCYLMQFDLSLPCDTSSFSLLSLEHIG